MTNFYTSDPRHETIDITWYC